LSTISTQLNWGAGYLVNDVYKRFIAPKASDKKFVAASRIVTLLLMGAGLAVTGLMDTISGVWAFIMECGAGLGLVLILRWYWWRINAWSEITATVAPFLAYAVSRWVFGWEFPNSYFFTISFTTVAWIVVTYATSPESMATLQKFYNQVRPDGNWRVISSGGEKNHNNLRLLAVCWLASIAMTYSVLFAIGKIIFREWTEALAFLAVIAVSGVILVRTLKRTSIWS
jgi:Na+/proline symporter